MDACLLVSKLTCIQHTTGRSERKCFMVWIWIWKSGVGLKVCASLKNKILTVNTKFKMAAKRRLSLRPGTRRGTASHHPNQEMIVTDDEDDLCERIRIRGIDFGNHCPICRRKLVVFDEETDNNSSGSGRVDNKSVKAVTPSNSRLLKSTNHIWKYLHETSRSSNDVNILPDFTFRTMVEVERGTSRITEVPTLCESCFPEILKLNMIHEDLEAVEKVLKLRIRKIRTIIQNSNSIQKVGTKHQNILESTDNCLKVDKFLTYIGAGVVKGKKCSD